MRSPIVPMCFCLAASLAASTGRTQTEPKPNPILSLDRQDLRDEGEAITQLILATGRQCEQDVLACYDELSLSGRVAALRALTWVSAGGDGLATELTKRLTGMAAEEQIAAVGFLTASIPFCERVSRAVGAVLSFKTDAAEHDAWLTWQKDRIFERGEILPFMRDVEKLLDVAASGRRFRRAAAAEALSRIPETSAHVDRLAALLETHDRRADPQLEWRQVAEERFEWHVARTILVFDDTSPAGARALGVLAELSPNAAYGRDCLERLARLRATAASAIDSLERLLERNDPSTLIAVARVVSALGRKGSTLAPSVASAIERSSGDAERALREASTAIRGAAGTERREDEGTGGRSGKTRTTRT